MRDLLNRSLEALIWIATGFFVVNSCFLGAKIIQLGNQIGGGIVEGFLFIVFGVTMSFVFAGICFQIMDIRTFTKHTAMAMKQRR
jgi:hypothetical protein